MIILILGCLILLLLIFILCAVGLYFMNFIKKMKKSRHPRIRFIKNNFRQLIFTFVAFFLIFVIIIILVKSVVGYFTVFDLERKHNLSGQGYTSDYKEVIKSIPFRDEINNDEQIIWEHLFCKELFFEKYQNWSRETSNFIKIRFKYKGEFCNMEELPSIRFEELIKHINDYYDTDILPAVDKSLEEVLEEIPPLEERQNVDAKLFQNEFFLRAEKCKSNSSAQCLYQVGRAADDAFKIISRENDISSKKMIFYGGMSVAFYLASIMDYNGDIDLVNAYYRIAEIYIYFEKYIDFVKEDLGYSQHCLLMAERFLMLAQDMYKDKGKNADIHEELPYFGFYYAEILDKYIRKYSKKREFFSMCSHNAQEYLDSPYSNGHEKCRNGCLDILKRIENY